MKGPAIELWDEWHCFLDRNGRWWRMCPFAGSTIGVTFDGGNVVRRYSRFIGAPWELAPERLQLFFDESKVVRVSPGWRYDEETDRMKRTDLSMLFRALRFAADHHRDDRRKGAGASPYINHPIEVASELVEVGVEDPEVLAAALLHDTVEDTWATPEEIEAKFGPRVRALVDAVTDDKSLRSRERKHLQVVHAPDLEPDAKLIKIADKTANVRDVGEDPPASWTLERRSAYLDWTERVVEGCTGVSEALERRYRNELVTARYRVRQALEAEETEPNPAGEGR